MRKLAVTIGCEGVRPRLSFAVSDAHRVADQLVGLGWEVRSLGNAFSSASRSSVVDTFREIAAEPVDQLLVYFAGHCVDFFGANCLLLDEGSAESPGVEVSELIRFSAAGVKSDGSITFLFDACRASENLPSMMLPSPFSASEARASVQNRANVHMLAVANSSGNSQETLRDGGGVFTSILCTGLKGEAADASGTLTVPGLVSYVTEYLSADDELSIVQFSTATSTTEIAKGLPAGTDARAAASTAYNLAKERAKMLVDNYHFRVQYTHDEKLQFGHLEYCNLLEPTLKWFSSIAADVPTLRTDSDFRGLQASVNGFASELAMFPTVGLNTRDGVIVQPLGHGNFGTVWMVEERNSSEEPVTRVALKVYHATDYTNELKRNRFLQGFSAMQSLNHGNIVAVRHYNECPVSFTMDYVDGPDLERFGGAYEGETDRLQIFMSVCDAIAHAHERDVLHRDIKPTNIILAFEQSTGRWIPQVTDFDLAWLPQSKDETRIGFGTESYSAPEQYAGFINAEFARMPTVDIFSLGRLLYYLIVGQDPLPATLDDSEQRNIKVLQNSMKNWPSANAVNAVMHAYDFATRHNHVERFQRVSDLQFDITSAISFLNGAESLTTVTRKQFVDDLIFAFNGQLDRSAAAILSRSGRVEASFSLNRSRDSFWTMECLLSPADGTVGGGGKTGSQVRQELNAQIAKAIDETNRVFPAPLRVRRRSGKAGSFSTTVIVENLELNSSNVAYALRPVFRAVEAIERYGYS